MVNTKKIIDRCLGKSKKIICPTCGNPADSSEMAKIKGQWYCPECVDPKDLE